MRAFSAAPTFKIWFFLTHCAILLLILPPHLIAQDDLPGEEIPVYKFGVTSWQHGQTVDKIRGLYRPMLEWLGNEVGAEFVIVGSRGYSQITEMLANESIHLASISPTPFILAQIRNPDVRMLVTELSPSLDGDNHSPFYEGYLVKHADRDDIDSLDAMEGLRLGMVKKPESTSGYIYPAMYFGDRGIEYSEHFERVYFLGSHPRVTDAIVAGSIDVGVTWDFNLKQAIKKHGDKFEIFSVIGTIPNLGIATNSSLPQEMADRIQVALLEIDHELLEGIPSSGFVIGDDEFYDEVRRAIENSMPIGNIFRSE
ncbi:phosphate/phosphite/phosphonate ABC transporter substrate-binding protein [Methylonatrum kenyense]|uniref:phosphate/phosphite/phosphonate ABC transporter substrate-binding protein n=1 Tax=Methylonatrum kenyense TaxID=455253 RepID=UPI0020BFD071|nr:phosphate/phosphite/phosphonate ABC transporter substrate-binding protein [Methylonatrum kenyense]MCK8516514.1 phosphate/phosphite/phosphonate ABC transporter substrate-binding protein [Methylonatrum kenyense]